MNVDFNRTYPEEQARFDAQEKLVMNETRRFDIFVERHIGFGIRWETGPYAAFPFHLSIAIPLVTITIGFGKRRGEL